MNKNYNKMFSSSKNDEKQLEGTKATVVVMDEPTQVVPLVPETNPDEETVPPKEPKEVVVNCQLLNIRKEPNKDSDIVCVVRMGDSLLVEDVVDGWSHVHTGPGQEGYIMSQFVKEE